MARKIAVLGIPEIDHALHQLGPTVANKIVRKGLRNAAKRLATDVKAEAPKASGKLVKSIKVRAGKRSLRRISIYVGVIDPEEGQIATHLEFGTDKMEADPFMRRAVAEDGEQVIEVALEDIGDCIEEALKEAGF